MTKAPRLSLILLLIALTAGLGCAHGLDRGTEAIHAQDYDRAESIARSELSKDPASPWANLLMAETYLARDNPRAALPYARRADRSDAYPLRVPPLLGEIYAALNQPVEAAESYHRARQTDASSVDDELFLSALVRAITHANVRRDHGKEFQLRSWLLDLDDAHPEAAPRAIAATRRAYVSVLRQQGEYLQAIELLEEALAGPPKVLTREALELGQVYAQLDMDDDAVEAWEFYLQSPAEREERLQRYRDVIEMAPRFQIYSPAIDALIALIDAAEYMEAAQARLQLAYFQLLNNQPQEGRESLNAYLLSAAADREEGNYHSTPYISAHEIALQANNPRLAIQILEEGSTSAAPSPALTQALADLYARRAQLDSVEEVLNRFVDRSPEPADALIFAGSWARQRNNFDLARHFYLRASELDAPPSSLFYDLAEILVELGEDDELAQALSAYLRAENNSDQALQRAAALYAEYRYFENAERLLTQLRRRHPENFDHANQLARLYQQWERPSEAFSTWDEWIRRRGNRPEDLNRVAQLVANQGDLERAGQLYRRAAEAGEDTAWLRAADIYLQQDHQAAMIRALESYLQANPGSPQALFDAAARYRRAGLDARHAEVLTELIALQPENWRPHDTLAALLLHQGRIQEAFDVYGNYVQHSSNQFAALEMIGATLSSRHPASWLIDFYQRWAQDDDVDPQIWRLIGDAYYSLSHESDPDVSASALREARRFYNRFLDASENRRLEWRNLAIDWNQRQMWGPAARAFRRFIDQGGAPHLYAFSFSETLLHLGETEEAEGILDRHFRQQNRRPDAALRISRLLMSFQRYEEARQYAQFAFVSGNDDAATEGFMLLAEILRQQEDFSALDRLVAEFPQRVSNRTRARRLLINVLENQGRWKEAAEHLEEFQDSVVDEAAFQLAMNRFRLGDADASFQAFERAAQRSPTPGRTWLQAADFYEHRGAAHLSIKAFDRAVQASPDDLEIRTARGVALIRRDRIDAAMEDYDFGLRSGALFTPTSRARYFSALIAAGHFDQARQVAESMDLSNRQTPAEIAIQVGSWDLRSQDPQTLQQAIARLQSRSWGLHPVLEHLTGAGHHRQNHELILEEFAEGDPSTASILLITHAPSVLRLSDWTLHRDLLDAVVDPLQRADTRLIGPLGDHRARRGDLPEARTYLQAAVDFDEEEYRPQLGNTLLLLGERDAAMEHFEAWLMAGNTRPEALEGLLLRFELAGDFDGASLFLDRLLDQPALLHIALPQKIHYELERHADPQRAIATLKEIYAAAMEIPSTAYSALSSPRVGSLSRDELLAIALVRSLENIAALGHLDAVEEVLTEDLLPAAQAARLEPLRLRLAISRNDADAALELARSLVAESDGVSERQQTRVALARQFIAFGVDAPARAIIDDALAEETNFRSHDPFLLKVGLLLLAGEEETILDQIQAYLESVPNRLETRRTLIDGLRRLGLDREALVLASEAAEMVPTENSLRQALVAALNEGDHQKARSFTSRLIAVAENPFDVLEEVLRPRFAGSEPFLILPVVEEIRKARPADLQWTSRHIQLLFRQGDVQSARELLLETAEARNFNREAITALTDVLHQDRRDVELARVLAPRLPEESLWPELLIRVAEAEYALGFPDRAQPWLERLDALSADADLWRTTLAEHLIFRRNYPALVALLAELDDAPPSPHLLYVQAVSDLASPDLDLAKSGLERLRASNVRGMRTLETHYHAIIAVLEGGHIELSHQLMADLTALSMRDNEFVHLPLHFMLRASMSHPLGAKAVLSFLEEERPRLVDGHGATWTRFAGLLAGAFERTDDPEGAFGFYRDRIWLSKFSRENDRALPVYLNNLAYTYSTSNQNIDAGRDMILRAMILSGERNSSYIDTLGWLLYRQGDLDAAEAEIRRALRSYDGPAYGLRELNLHLQEILNHRAIYDQAAWLDAEIQRFPFNEFEW